MVGSEKVRDTLTSVLEADRNPDGPLRQDNVFRYVQAGAEVSALLGRLQLPFTQADPGLDEDPWKARGLAPRELVTQLAVAKAQAEARAAREAAERLEQEAAAERARAAAEEDELKRKQEAAAAVGKAIAEKGTGAGVETVAFDRNGYLYHGRVKTLADAAREAGLKF